MVLSQTFDVLSAHDMLALSGSWQEAVGVIAFKGVHYPKSVILHAVSSTSATPSPTVTWRRSWQSAV
ncbi:hypothetical protein RV134_210148 [Roseovarius sp. EC-HK134]|nr:hypothetical protein RV134_210148 [Roseovarius sp. EC-HK134]VVT01522.1 hypothetical protein RV420_260013 [Roseovarius sp. EC-SD190]